ncbi:hypothetical protein GQ42DRAFT_161147 [Ramicandelaber brevisporus]|nr:hypothetical protein GQ42DRAFT_161147 [Ramicandelaber brevisporus]
MPRNVKYDLLYWKDINGRGEVIKAIFALANVDYTYTDVQLADWLAVKATTPLGHVPVLRIIDADTGETLDQLAESGAIERWLAKHFGVLNLPALDSDAAHNSAANNSADAAHNDADLDTPSSKLDTQLAKLEAIRADIEFASNRFWEYHNPLNGCDQSDRARDNLASTFQSLVTHHERILAANSSDGAGNGHYFGTKITTADLALVNLVKYARHIRNADAFEPDSAPLINKVVDAVTASPELRDYYIDFDARLAQRTF